MELYKAHNSLLLIINNEPLWQVGRLDLLPIICCRRGWYLLISNFPARIFFILTIIGFLDLGVSFSTDYMEDFPRELQSDSSIMKEVTEFDRQ